MRRYTRVTMGWNHQALERRQRHCLPGHDGGHPTALHRVRSVARGQGNVATCSAQATYHHVSGCTCTQLLIRADSPGSAARRSSLFFLFMTMMFLIFYLSIGFQAAYHTSATGAGVKLLPMILVQVATLIISSRTIPKIGRFKWIIVAGPCFLMLSSGLFYTVKYGTSIGHLYGYQVIFGIGIGLAMQNSMLAVQFDLKSQPWLISAGTGAAVFSESFSLDSGFQQNTGLTSCLCSRVRRSNHWNFTRGISVRKYDPSQLA